MAFTGFHRESEILSLIRLGKIARLQISLTLSPPGDPNLAPLWLLHTTYQFWQYAEQNKNTAGHWNMSSGPYDPRGIANLLLDVADDAGLSITNLALQKLIYFAHGIHLMQTKEPLVSGYFEAWQYGPVHPSVYRAFNDAGSQPLRIRATGKDALTGRERELKKPDDPDVRQLIQDVLRHYGRMSAGRLVDLSHAEGAPWDVVVHKSRTDIAFGMRIPDSIIADRFGRHKVSIGLKPRIGEPCEDAPFA